MAENNDTKELIQHLEGLAARAHAIKGGDEFHTAVTQTTSAIALAIGRLFARIETLEAEVKRLKQ